jgi:hypothetical protein
MRCVWVVCFALSLSACTSEVSTPTLTSEEIDHEVSFQENMVESWILENESQLQERLKTGTHPTPSIPRDNLNHIGRVADIWYRITTANAPLCTNYTAPEIGIWVDHLTTKNQHQPWAKKLRLSRTQPTIIAVANGSPAQRVGLEKGDRIVAINHRRPGVNASLHGLPFDDPITLSVVRNEQFVTLEVKPVRACNYSVAIRDTRTRNAYATGKAVVIYGGMIDYVKDDNELALIMSHELAHNIMRHIRKGVINSTIGYSLGAIVQISLGMQNVPGAEIMADIGEYLGQRFNHQGFETEADYVGLYIAARAQYDIDNVADLWRRMSHDAPDQIDTEWGTHPSNAKRYLNLKKTRDEIKLKIAEGEPIVPDLWHSNTKKPQDIAPKLGMQVFN